MLSNFQTNNWNASRAANLSSASLQARAELERRRRKALAARPLSFRDYVGRVNPRFQWYRHCEALAAVAERVASDELKRVLIFFPPRHSKSETISRLFTGYYLYRHPERWVGINSYAAELAFTFSRAARANYQAMAGPVDGGASAVKHWETGKGGGCWAAGVGGPITGKGFHLGVIDDPLKNADDAASEVIRAKQKDWYQSTFYTRAEPDASIVVIQTRWHEDDLSGWLLEEEQGDNPERWHVVNLPALAEAPRQFPETCTVEPDWRDDGAALCPERYSADRLTRIRDRIGEYYFGALYQQRPTAREGSFFKVERLQIVDAAPLLVRECRGWDLAASANKGDYTAGVRLGVDSDGVWYVTDVRRGQYSTDDRDALLRQVAALDGGGVKIRLAQDPGQAGKDQAIRLTRMLAGSSVRTENVTGAKETRADAFSAQVNAGNVRLVKGDWNKAFIEELRLFPAGKYDDQIDAAADAFNELNGHGPFEQGKWIR